MGASLNKALIIGRLGRDPECRDLPGGDKVANLSVATDESWTDKSGAKQEKTEWHRVSFFGRQAEIAERYLSKGRLVYVEGSIQTRKWQDKDGQDRYSTEIKGFRFQMLDSAQDGGGASSTGSSPGRPRMDRPELPEAITSGGYSADDGSDDIPF